MSKGFGVIRDLSRRVSQRTVQVTVVPTPTKFTERRAVLHALQKFANIEVFRKLDKHDASFISVTSDVPGADNLVNNSPLKYQLESGESTESVRAFLTTQPSSEPILGAASSAGNGVTTQALGIGTSKKQFAVHVFPANDYIHSSTIRASPLHGPWPEGRRDTAMYSVLKRTIPSSIATEGLSDWESAGQCEDMARGKKVEELVFGQKSMDTDKRALHMRLKKQEQKKNMPAVMDGLAHLRNQGSQGQRMPTSSLSEATGLGGT